MIRRHAFQFYRGSVGHDAAAGKDHSASADCVNFLENVSLDDDGLGLGHLPYQQSDLLLLVGIEAIRRLVEY